MRLATQHDVSAIMAKLAALLDKSPAPRMRHADLMSAECGVRHAIHEERGIFFGPYFLMFEVGKPWCSDKVHLCEEILLKVYDTDPSWPLSRVVQEGLSSLAQQVGAEVIAVGDTQIGYMVPHYEAAGFVVAGTQLMKEV
jgi:hypothetical protein